MRLRFLVAAALASAAAPSVLAQSAPTPVPTGFPPPVVIDLPPPGSAPVQIPRVVPTPTPTVAPSLTASPVVRPTPRASASATPRPTPLATATPRAVPQPPVAAATPTAAPPPAPASTQAPAVALPEPSGPPVVARTEPADTMPSRGIDWRIIAGGGGVAVAVLALAMLLRRRRRASQAALPEDEPSAAPADVLAIDTPAVSPPESAPSAAPAMFSRPVTAPVQAEPSSAPRAWLAFTLRPRRAGVNLLTATLDAEILVRNEGDAAAEEVRVQVALLSARAGQEAELGQLFAAPITRPATRPFALAPGEERSVPVLATLARGAINVLSAGGRDMFVPVAAVNLRYVTAGGAAQTAQAFAIGIERAGAAKLAPFRLDPPRTHEAVAARPHALALRS